MSGRIRRIASAVLLMFVSFQASGETRRSSAVSGAEKTRLEHGIREILAHPDLSQATVGVKIVSLRSGETLFAFQADRLFHPASNTKLFTAVNALYMLGPDYRHLTRLYGDDTLRARGDTLVTALYLYGTGDPLFDTDDMDGLAAQIAGYGFRVITGDLIADDSYFDDARLGEGWMWDDAGFDFSAQISALTLNLNCVTAIASPGDSAGALVRLRLDPPTAYVETSVTARTGNADEKTPFRMERRWKERRNILDATGWLSPDATERRLVFSVEDPALYAATILRDRLAARGVTVTGQVRRGYTPVRAQTLALHVSAPLTESVAFMLKESDNLAAELLLKSTGRRRTGETGSARNGLAALRNVVTALTGVDTLSYRFADGSGLSWYNLITPSQTVSLLAAAYRDSTLRKPLWAALPAAGVEGTLKNRMRSSPANGTLRAKTGTLSAVSCLSGFVHSAEGEPLVFSVMINNFVGSSAAARRAQDEIGTLLASFRRKQQE
ncbi:MAG: D-alanyl-D-alanine carboxypeptidase/D-alanyl-D-alanine-endopeptidase [candidate division Zixibacteria bacterium]|nr:D-alanyl-D-alanine carboxypeptidase/D-alanyl-D-alanine-endopeptidase [candidate division Zixibacteria bacterium]